MISFADEYRRKVETVSRKSSYRERAFYSYLTDTICPSIYSTKTDLSELDEVCRFVFCGSSSYSEDVIGQAIEKHRSRRPDRPGHYSNNIILLSAFSLYNAENEKEYIENQFKNGSGVHRFVLSHVFSDANLTSKMFRIGQHRKVENSIERIADLLLSGQTDAVSLEALAQGLIEADSLVECFVVLKAYHAQLQASPLPELKSDVIRIARPLNCALARLRKRAKQRALAISVILFLFILLLFFLLLYVAAPTLTTEQRFIIGVFLSIFGALTSFFLPRIVSKWSVFDWLQQRIEQRLLRKYVGVDTHRSIARLAGHYAKLEEEKVDMAGEFVLGRTSTPEPASPSPPGGAA